MRTVIQRVLNASVSVDNRVVSEIERGELILVGFTHGDDESVIDKMINKILKLRIFEDEKGLTNLSINDVNGNILAVSQFTLYADVAKGNRPSFVKAMGYDDSLRLYNYFVNRLLSLVPDAKFGIFGADMKVSLVNDGPFSLVIDSEDLK